MQKHMQWKKRCERKGEKRRGEGKEEGVKRRRKGGEEGKRVGRRGGKTKHLSR